MNHSSLISSINQRRTFAIISHPDAGKTTFTEQLLYVANSINTLGAVKSKNADKHATSDWMAMEQERGISVSTSAMKFFHHGIQINLLDTPGHHDFSEDTYRTLTAVDCALMIIDAAKGVEDRTIKLMEVCRLRNIPIVTFINKLDRESKDPFALLDEIEKVLKIKTVPINWPISSGRNFKGIYDIASKNFKAYNQKTLDEFDLKQLNEDLEMINGVIEPFSHNQFDKGLQTPVFFGSAIKHFGIKEFLDKFTKIAPTPATRAAKQRNVDPNEAKFSGFIFKIQANMDPKHHDRIAFMRVVSGAFSKGMKLYQVRTNKNITPKAVNLFAKDRDEVISAYPGDIIGLHNYGSINVGDTFTQGEKLKFTGIPSFAPLLFKAIISKDPLKQKALQKGVNQLCQEGATQLFKYTQGNKLILGAIGTLQFDVVMHRLKHEYKAECLLEACNVSCVRWINGDLGSSKELLAPFLATDIHNRQVFLANSLAHLRLWQDKLPSVEFNHITELLDY